MRELRGVRLIGALSAEVDTTTFTLRSRIADHLDTESKRVGPVQRDSLDYVPSCSG